MIGIEFKSLKVSQKVATLKLEHFLGSVLTSSSKMYLYTLCALIGGINPMRKHFDPANSFAKYDEFKELQLQFQNVLYDAKELLFKR